MKIILPSLEKKRKEKSNTMEWTVSQYLCNLLK